MICSPAIISPSTAWPTSSLAVHKKDICWQLYLFDVCLTSFFSQKAVVYCFVFNFEILISGRSMALSWSASSQLRKTVSICLFPSSGDSESLNFFLVSLVIKFTCAGITSQTLYALYRAKKMILQLSIGPKRIPTQLHIRPKENNVPVQNPSIAGTKTLFIRGGAAGMRLSGWEHEGLPI